MNETRRSSAALEVRGLDVYYGHSHALQGVDLSLDAGVFSVVGRNGMGKTTLCKAIMGLVPVSGGSIRVRGEDITRRPPAHIARLGVGYVPQGRRLWRSLSVDEHLRLAGGMRSGSWTVERIYDTFPATCRTQGPWWRSALRRRAADARDFPRAADKSAAPDHGRADRGACARHRRPGRGDAAAARRGRRHVRARDRAEHRRGDRGLAQRRDHGQRPHQSHHRLWPARRRPRAPAAPARRWLACRTYA